MCAYPHIHLLLDYNILKYTLIFEQSIILFITKSPSYTELPTRLPQLIIGDHEILFDIRSLLENGHSKNNL